jgi:membrane-bound serine protease (ClpP class)
MGAATVVDGSGKKASEKMQSYMRSLMRSTAEARGRNPRLAEAMVEENLSVDNIVSAGQLLSLSTDEAIRTHMANGQANSLEQVAFKMDWGSARLIHEDSRWQEVLLTYLASPVVSALLMLLMLGGLFFELHSPGLGIPGLIAATSALLFFAPLYVLGLAQGWEIVLFFVGVLLIILEIFVIPGFGITGISGIILVVLSLGAALVGNIGLDFPSLSNLSTAIWTMLVTLLLSVLMIVSLARYLPGTSRFSRLILKVRSGDVEDYIAASSIENLLGKEGEALTTLRPSGTVLVNGSRVDVVSDGEFINKGEKIRITEVSGNRVVAARVNGEDPAKQPPKEDKIDS